MRPNATFSWASNMQLSKHWRMQVLMSVHDTTALVCCLSLLVWHGVCIRSAALQGSMLTVQPPPFSKTFSTRLSSSCSSNRAPLWRHCCRSNPCGGCASGLVHVYGLAFVKLAQCRLLVQISMRVIHVLPRALCTKCASVHACIPWYHETIYQLY